MKKTITLLLCLCSTLFFAQNTSSITPVEELPNWSAMLANLPTSQITSGILLDKIVDYSNLTNFNTTESNVSDSKHFIQAMSELYKASNQSLFISTTTLKNNIA